MKAVRLLVDFLSYMRVFISPYGIGMVISLIVFLATKSITALVLGTTISTAAGVLFAEHVRRSYGSVNFMSALIGTPEISNGGPEVIQHILYPNHTGNAILFQTNKALYAFAIGGIYRVVQYDAHAYEKRELNYTNNTIDKVYADEQSVMLVLQGGQVIFHQCTLTAEGNYARALLFKELTDFRADYLEVAEEIKLYTV